MCGAFPYFVFQIAEEFEIPDIDGDLVPHIRSIRGAVRIAGYSKAASYIPYWLKIPEFIFYFLLLLVANKF